MCPLRNRCIESLRICGKGNMIRSQNPPVTFWSWDCPRSSDVLGLDGLPYRGDQIQFHSFNGGEPCEVLRPTTFNVGTVPVMAFHRCGRHKLLLVRWQPDNFNSAHPLPSEEATA